MATTVFMSEGAIEAVNRNDVSIIGSPTVSGVEETVQILDDSLINIRIDPNVERIELPSNLAKYQFKLEGNIVAVEVNGSQLLTVDLNKETRFAFADGSANLSINQMDQADLGGIALSDEYQVLTGAQLDTSDPSSVAKVSIFKFDQDTLSVVEGNSGEKSVTLTVSRTGDINSFDQINVEVVDVGTTATENDDYELTTKSVSFGSGQTTKDITLSIQGDTRFESDETIQLLLTATGTSSAIIDPNAGRADITIENDDLPNEPTFSLSISPTDIAEGDIGSGASLSVNITRDDTRESATVELLTSNDTAIAGKDYTDISTKVEFAVGESSKIVNIPIIGDTDIEGDESFTIFLNNPSMGKVHTIDGTASIKILDDDSSNPTFNLSVSETSVLEGAANTQRVITATITRDDAREAASIDLRTSDDSATAGEDYQALTQTVQFAEGETEKTVDITVLGDDDLESDEQFTVALDKASIGQIDPIANEQRITITNDDASNPTFNLSVDLDTVQEGNSGEQKTITATITRDNIDEAATVDVLAEEIVVDPFEISGHDAATKNTDFGEYHETLSFAIGESSKTVAISVFGDDDIENPEVFQVSLANPSIGELNANATHVLVSIEDDDVIADDFSSDITNHGVIALNTPKQGHIETAYDHDWFSISLDSNYRYTIDLKGDHTSAAPLVDPYLYGLYDASGNYISGTENDDFSGPDSQITFTPTTSGTYYIAAGAYADTTGQYNLSVVDELIIEESPTFTLAANDTAVNEGATTTFALTTTNVAEGTDVAFTISGVDAADVTGGLTGNATVDAAGAATIALELIADSLTEGAETLTLTLDDDATATQSVTVNDTSVDPVIEEPRLSVVNVNVYGIDDIDGDSTHDAASNDIQFNISQYSQNYGYADYTINNFSSGDVLNFADAEVVNVYGSYSEGRITIYADDWDGRGNSAYVELLGLDTAVSSTIQSVDDFNDYFGVGSLVDSGHIGSSSDREISISSGIDNYDNNRGEDVGQANVFMYFQAPNNYYHFDVVNISSGDVIDVSWAESIDISSYEILAYDWDNGKNVYIDLEQAGADWGSLSNSTVDELNSALGYTAIKMNENLPAGLSSDGVINVDSNGLDDHDFNHGEDASNANITFNVSHPSASGNYNDINYFINEFGQGDILNLPTLTGDLYIYVSSDRLTIYAFSENYQDGSMTIKLTGLDNAPYINDVEDFNAYFGEGSLNFV